MPSASADLDAQALLAQALKAERAFLYAHGEYELQAKELRAFDSMLARRAAGEPVAYILGERGFYDIALQVTPSVLIPRPETELLLEEALRLVEPRQAKAVADIGTGSGALAIALARQRPRSKVCATDISEAALNVARRNAKRHGADIAFSRGDLAQPLIERGVKLDLLMANLPYIATDDLPGLAVSDWEPRLALDGGADGLALIRRLLEQLQFVCAPRADVLLEIGANQGDAVKRLVAERLQLEAIVLQDYASLDRIVRFSLDSQC